MATIRSGHHVALMIVDAQVAVMRGAWQSNEVLQRLYQAVSHARAAHMPIIWVQHDDDELVANTNDWAWAPPLCPASDELLIRKHFNSAFENTPLEEHLSSWGITHIVLAGAATNWCIRATAYGALDRGYDLTLIADAHTTKALDLGDGRGVDAADLILDLNTAMTWLSYPGRSNRALPLSELDFDALSRATS